MKIRTPKFQMPKWNAGTRAKKVHEPRPARPPREQRAKKVREPKPARASAPTSRAALPVFLHYARLVLLAVFALIVVVATGVAFVESYGGLHEWALEHGLEGNWAAAWPLQVDTFIAAGEITLFIAIVDRWPTRSRLFGWVLTLSGLAVSVAGNVGHVVPDEFGVIDGWSQFTAAVPPITAMAGLMAGLGVLKRVLGLHTAEDTDPEPAAPAAPPQPLSREYRINRGPSKPQPVTLPPREARPATNGHRPTVSAQVPEDKPRNTEPFSVAPELHPKWDEAITLYRESLDGEGKPHSQRSLAAALNMANRTLAAAAIRHVQGGTA